MSIFSRIKSSGLYLYIQRLWDNYRANKICTYYLNNKEDLLKMKYSDLYVLIENNYELFAEIKSFITKTNLHRMKEKVIDNQTVRVAFLVYSSSIWQYESVYRMMKNDSRFFPFIVLTTFGEPNKKTSFEQYKMSKKWFEDNGYNLVCVNDHNQKYSLNNWKKLKIDLLFAAVPYCVFPKSFCSWNAYLDSLICYAPYGVNINSMDKRYFDLVASNIAWTNFYESNLQKENAKKYAKVGDDNVVVSGYLKMDVLLQKTDVKVNIWKNNSKNNLKRIIYAPHHSLERKKSKFSTFDTNYRVFLELARKYSDSTTWIFKPHPMLKRESVDVGLFKTIEEYENYINEWRDLPNADVVTVGDYSDLFLSSDAMILDSESFLFEYQYTRKPILFLRNTSQEFNVLGEKLLEVSYTANGDNPSEIEEFIRKVVIDEDDYKKLERDKFYNEYLDYYSFNNGKYAGEYVFDYIIDSIMKG